ncbi:glycine amidinotransferase [Streptomyces eurocidicus]|uniref:Glycine amidinotransferase n=1 Tax=Streptomyces eurocidicus TaxID=66423 RepID=A0A2N8P0D7_STREU|nr:glycine amidinotransferase [Streptomyces eurocidicus]MBB5121698.1 glycine amidinotransferase [Streptomyces eurocidicus]MBF6052922.1 glycine amidinotransferase [Streptomyces eurocidicus]PNE34480.1 glycine amidinotransferase [Streptomyces eurocidicus]
MSLNSYDEWSPLKEVIVGSAQNYTSHERELSFDLFFHENITQDNVSRSEWYYPRVGPSPEGAPRAARSPIKQRYVEELNEDVEGIAEVLESLSVKVHRPMSVQDAAEVRTPAWSAGVVPPLNVRDNTLILGDEIIETPPMIRSRYFETQFLTPVFADYFRRGARWTVMPRPLMTDASFDLSYARTATAGGPVEPIGEPRPSPYDVGHEMMFDGAQCLRLGKDLVVNISTANHALAVDWLERHLEGRFRVHRVHRLSDSHIDSMVLALRPGTLLVRSKEVAEYLPEPLRSWDLIVPPEATSNNFPRYEDDDLILTSRYIDLNVLSVGPDTVLVNEACPELMRTLESRGFTVVPVRHRHRRLFGGGFHCFTLDTVREGSGPEDYFGG